LLYRPEFEKDQTETQQHEVEKDFECIKGCGGEEKEARLK
jgi:hypothetical protein